LIGVYTPPKIGRNAIVPTARGLKRLYFDLFGVPDVRVHLSAAYLSRLFATERPRRVLDIGCGNGWLSCYLASRYPEVQFVGWDRDRESTAFATHVARESGLRNIQFDVRDIERDGVSAERFDCIICVAVLQFVVDTRRVVRRIAGLLTPGGSVIVQIPRAETRGLLMRYGSVARRMPRFAEARGGFSDAEWRDLVEAGELSEAGTYPAIKGPSILAKELYYVARSINVRVAEAVSPLLNWVTVLDPWYPGKGNGLFAVARKMNGQG
jgi:trans-aconitate methyltransferase